MTPNQQLAESLEKIAALYRQHEDLKPISSATIYIDTKEDLRSTIKMIGGRWAKIEHNYNDSWSTLEFKHADSGLSLRIDRDKVCRKVVRYECEPVLSPEEETEILTEAAV